MSPTSLLPSIYSLLDGHQWSFHSDKKLYYIYKIVLYLNEMEKEDKKKRKKEK